MSDQQSIGIEQAQCVGIRELENIELDVITGGTGDDVDPGTPALNNRRAVRVDRAYRK